VAIHRKLVSASGDLDTARELAADDESFVEEVAELESRVAELDTPTYRHAVAARPA